MSFLYPLKNTSFLQKTFIVYFILSFVTLIILLYKRQEVINNGELESMCSNLIERDALLAVEDLKFPPGSDPIFFHETSCRGALTSRQACSIESAARAHPKRLIYVLFSSPVSEQMLMNSLMATLGLQHNIYFARVHLEEYAKNTPLEEMVARKMFYINQWWVELTSDALRVLTLYKYGGVYLDTDVLVAKSLTPLGKNWVGMEDSVNANTAVIAVSKDLVGRSLINALLNEIKVTFEPNIWGYNGPKALTRVLHKICGTSNATEWSASTCNGFAVYKPEYFYPVPYTDAYVYIKPGDLSNKYKKAYAFHFWNKLTRSKRSRQESPFIKMAEKLCPAIFQIYLQKKSENLKFFF